MTPDENTALKQAWKATDTLVILDIARMVKAGYLPAQILAEAMLKKMGKGK